MPLLQLTLAMIFVAVAAWLVNSYARLSGNVALILNTMMALIVVGMALWVIDVYVPMAESIKAILNITAVIATCVRVLQVFGLWGHVVRLWRSFITRHPPESPTGSQIG